MDDRPVSPDDPLGLDRWFAEGPPLTERSTSEILEQLHRAVTTPVPDQPDVALAELRDLDGPLCVIERREPGSYRQVVGLEARLLRLGRVGDHIPRSCNDLYGPRNPRGDRTRTITGLPAEHLLIEALRAGGVGLDSILAGLETLASSPDGYAMAEAALGFASAWDPMVASAVRMRREMPLDVFSHDLIPWLVPLDIGGTVYRAPTGAQFSNSQIDWVLWGVEVAEHDEDYRVYAQAFRAETPRRHRELVARTLGATGGRSLLSALPERLRGAHPATTRAVLDGLDDLLRRIRDFRVIHQRFAVETLEMRPGVVGSGMQAEPQFGPLLGYTRDARARLSRIRADWERQASA